MSKQRPQAIPAWAQRERLSDLTWIGANMHLFWPAAQEQYQARGRGAIVVDTVHRPLAQAGNPFTYLDVAELAALDERDAVRMARAYDPARQVVILLLKGDRSSVYRLGVVR